MKRKLIKALLSVSFAYITLAAPITPAFAKTPVPLSKYMSANQYIYLNADAEVRMSGFTWSGGCNFMFFVTPLQKNGSTTLVRIDRIIRLWWADEKEYFAIRETTCKKFPCSDEKGQYFDAPSPLNSNIGIGDTAWVDSNHLVSRGTLVNKEKSGQFGIFMDDKVSARGYGKFGF